MIFERIKRAATNEESSKTDLYKNVTVSDQMVIKVKFYGKFNHFRLGSKCGIIRQVAVVIKKKNSFLLVWKLKKHEFFIHEKYFTLIKANISLCVYLESFYVKSFIFFLKKLLHVALFITQIITIVNFLHPLQKYHTSQLVFTSIIKE